MTSKYFLTKYPHLLKEWHPIKNGELTLETAPYDAVKRFWWKCPKGDDHEWEASMRYRVRHKRCPYCINRKASSTNNLLKRFPELAKEWHPTKNGSVSPMDVIYGSGKTFWWLCPKGSDHEWKTGVNRRTQEKTGCPFCSNHKLSKTNSLSASYPEIAKEWHPEKNGNLTPYDVMPATTKKVWWLCPRKHVWQVRVAKRTGRGQSCPHCKKRNGD